MSIMRLENGDVFEMTCDPIDVTMLHRADTDWRFVDTSGHEHAWYVNGHVATHYDPISRHELPTLRWVEDIPATDDYPAYGHHECLRCNEHVEPRYASDTSRQYIPGVRRCYINGQPVSREEFERRFRVAYPDVKF